MRAAFPLRRTTPRSTHARAGRAELSYLEPVVEAELMESAELVREDLTRSLWGNRWSAIFVSWDGLATSLGLHGACPGVPLR